jgi:hypothetical protein
MTEFHRRAPCALRLMPVLLSNIQEGKEFFARVQLGIKHTQGRA